MTTDWMTAGELAESLGVSFKTVRRRAGRVVGGVKIEERAAHAADATHHRTRTLFRAVEVHQRAGGSALPEIEAQPPETLTEFDTRGRLRWSESRRAELIDANETLRRSVAALEQQVVDLEANYREALSEKHAARANDGASHLLDSILSALGGVGEDDMREILSQAVRDHIGGHDVSD